MSPGSPWSKAPVQKEVFIGDNLNRRISNGLDRRYPGTSDKQLAISLAQEFGLDHPANALSDQSDLKMNFAGKGIPWNPYKKLPGAAGMYTHEGNQLSVMPEGGALPREMIRTAIAHELAHAADLNTDRLPLYPGAPGMHGPDPVGHFQKIAGEQSLADTLDGQAMLETGLYGPNGIPQPDWMKQAVGNNPWLKNVAPMASNNLANPWAGIAKPLNGPK